LFILPGAYFLRMPRRMTAKFCTQARDEHVQDMCWVYVYRGRRYKNNRKKLQFITLLMAIVHRFTHRKQQK